MFLLNSEFWFIYHLHMLPASTGLPFYVAGICAIFILGIWIFSKIFKGIWDTGTPPPPQGLIYAPDLRVQLIRIQHTSQSQRHNFALSACANSEGGGGGVWTPWKSQFIWVSNWIPHLLETVGSLWNIWKEYLSLKYEPWHVISNNVAFWQV